MFCPFLSCTKRVFPPRPTQNCFTRTRLLSTSLCTSQQLVPLLHLMYSAISDAGSHKWPATSRAEPVPSTRAVATLKHPKPPLLAAASIRCGSVFLCKCSCEVRAGQCQRSPWQGTERCWGQGEVGCQAAPGWGTGSNCALVSARGPLTHGSHTAVHPVGVPGPATLQRARPANPSHAPLGTSPAVPALQPTTTVKLRV